MGFFDKREPGKMNDSFSSFTSRNRYSSIIVIVLIVILYVMYTFMGQSDSCGGKQTTTGRIKLDAEKCTFSGHFYSKEDELSGDELNTLNECVINFYELTGVEPYVLVVEDGKEHTVTELNEMAKEFYDGEYFNVISDSSKITPDQGHMVITYQLMSNDNYRAGVYVGTDAATVIDGEALGYFGEYLAKNYNKYTGSKVFAETFKQVGSKIMGRSKSTVYMIILVGVLLVGWFGYNIFRTKKNLDNQKSQEENDKSQEENN